MTSTTEAPAWVERDGERCYVVFWHGYQHGILHMRLDEALQHRDKLNEAPEWDQQAWLARHRGAA